MDTLVEERPFLTLVEVARRLNVSVDTLQRIRDRGELAAIKIGGQWRVEPEELDRFLEAQRRRGAGP